VDHASPEAPPLLALEGIEKRYGGVHALRGAALTIARPGVVHVLIGENGSGKSTLLGVLSGQVRPDRGTIRLGGRPVRFPSPVTALGSGIAMVSQERAVAADLSVAENVLLGRSMVRRWSGLSPKATRAKAQDVLARLELDYDPRWRVGDLRADQQQMVEIARALSTDAQVLILDEPTSSLTDDEVTGLFGAVRRLKAQGVAILFVSHRMPELFEIGDEVTVLRDGCTVAQAPIADFDAVSLVQAMVGDGKPQSVRSPAGTTTSGTADMRPPALTVTGLTAGAAVRGVDLEVRPGEIVGLAGLVGAGRSELLEALFGARPVDAGEMAVDGEPYSPRGPRDAIAQELGFLPPDRKTDGLVLGMSLSSNATMVRSLRRSRLAPPDEAADQRVLAPVSEALRLKAASSKVPAGSLSGGNQQKVALAKWLVCQPKVLLLDEPTRGVDVVAKAEIHDQLRAAAAAGTALLVSSSENEELLGLCHRILVLFRGRVVAAVSPDNADEATLLRLAGGHAS
jgi:ABC-type sugar transport system ATPase subunit